MFPTKNIRRQKAFWIKATAAVAAACVPPANLHAGTIRHDRDDQVYQMMAEKEGWQAVGQMGQISPNGQFVHSCTLAVIDHQWVLCAAHCIHDIDRGTGIYNESPPPLLRIGSQLVQLNAVDVFVHPTWIQSGASLSAGYDIALFRLPAPLDPERRRPRPQGRQPVTRQPVDPGRAIIPLRINTKRTEVGQRATSVGFGQTGTGLTGPVAALTPPEGTRRAGVNTIDNTAARLWPSSKPELQQTVGNQQTLVFDFDSPLTNALNALGSPAPLDYEYCPAPGDSGGPLFLPDGEIAGVVSGGYRRLTSNFSAYGTIAIYTRVSAFRDWIDSVKAGNEPSFEVMIPILRTAGFVPGEAAPFLRSQALRRAQENYIAAIAGGWVPHKFIGSTPGLQVAESYGKLFPAPFGDREINPLPVMAAISEVEIVTSNRRGLDSGNGWGLDSTFGDVGDLPLDFECVSCGGHSSAEGNQPAADSAHADSLAGVPDNDDAPQSVLVEPR